MSPYASHVLIELERLAKLRTPISLDALERAELPRKLIEHALIELLECGHIVASNNGLALRSVD